MTITMCTCIIVVFVIRRNVCYLSQVISLTGHALVHKEYLKGRSRRVFFSLALSGEKPNHIYVAAFRIYNGQQPPQCQNQSPLSDKKQHSQHRHPPVVAIIVFSPPHTSPPPKHYMFFYFSVLSGGVWLSPTHTSPDKNVLLLSG